jgi:hypothetical protein
MLIENSFRVAADPDRVFEFLADAHSVVACLPGAELVEDLGDDSYQGKVKIKVGPVTAAYQGIATITTKDPVERLAVLLAEGKDTKGNGAAKATATMRVLPAEGGAADVTLSTDLSVSGKLAQFGRSVLGDVSNKMVGEMASRVRERIEAAEPAPAGPGATTASGTDPVAAPVTTPAQPARDDAIKASGIVWAVLAGVFRRLFARLRGRDVKEST